MIILSRVCCLAAYGCLFAFGAALGTLQTHPESAQQATSVAVGSLLAAAVLGIAASLCNIAGRQR